jgi:dihydroorotate dehydrogenase
MKIIGVGGIHDKESARIKMDLGCDLIQIYTAFIYRGTDLVGDILA